MTFIFAQAAAGTAVHDLCAAKPLLSGTVRHLRTAVNARKTVTFGHVADDFLSLPHPLAKAAKGGYTGIRNKNAERRLYAMSMRDFGLAVKALGRGVYSVFSTMRDVEYRDISIL